MLIVRAKKKYPSWGPKKLRYRLQELHPGVNIPAASTIGQLLKERGLVKARKSRRRTVPSTSALRPGKAPNHLWAIDFKGQFRLGNRKYCYPLTVSDDFSRYLLCCECLEGTQGEPVMESLALLFKEYGLPSAIRSDNGTPFASTGFLGLSQLSVWLLRLKIDLQRIQPGQPQQNGRHERMHLTLKEDATRPAAKNLFQQQEKFDDFQRTYNSERPHESLNMRTPGSIYKPSARRYPSHLEPLQYPMHDLSCLVYADGRILLRGTKKQVKISSAFAGELLGLRKVDDGTWLTTFMDQDLGYIDTETAKLLPMPSAIETTETPSK